MASADSIIRVAIVGDAKGMTKALGSAEGSLKGIATKAGGALLGLAAVDKAFEFLDGSTKEADRLGDAITRLNIQIGETDTAKLREQADDYHDIGLSSQDVLELSANFADLGINAGIASPVIADLADDVSATAAAMSLLDDSDAAGNVDLIGKAAAGNAKAMRSLGISVSEADVTLRALTDTGKKNETQLTAGEKATARLNLVLDALKPKLDAATTGSGDLEQSQRKLQAQAEELQGKLGGPLSDALQTVTGFINDEIDAIPHAIDGFIAFGRIVAPAVSAALGPLQGIKNTLEAIIDLTRRVGPAQGLGTVLNKPRPSGLGSSDSEIRRSTTRTAERNGVRDRIGGP